MCGIAGIATATGHADSLVVKAMRDAMAHRGPDDAGLWSSADGRVSLGHRRLAVIDLSSDGRQPMTDGSGRLWITFNGEIYNYQALRRELEGRGHRFRSKSDTEVILEAFFEWGPQFLHRLNGMFAFALFDSATQRLLLARDRAGEKPLFYRWTSHSLMFASELKGLLEAPEVPRRLDLDALLCYLTYGYVPGDACILTGVSKLPAGSVAVYDLAAGSLVVERYWQLPPLEPPPSPVSKDVEEALVDELDGLLSDSVRTRMLADVPVGILLSGGLDSSLITAVAAREVTDVRTFTVAFPGDQRYDESQHARIVARHFGTKHTELAAERPRVELLEAVAAQVDEPLADSSLIPTYLVSELIRSEATVALGGDGGDELFAGYRHYSALQRQETIRKVVPRRLMPLPGIVAARLLPTGFRGRNFLLGLTPTTAESIAGRNLFFDNHSRLGLLSTALRASAARRPRPEEILLGLCSPERTALQQATTVDFLTYLPDDLLVKVDRASMLTSLEMRAPWLDHRIIELAFSRVPDELRATTQERKVLPKRLAERVLPGELDISRKHGFTIPLRSWFLQGWGSYVRTVLGEAEPELFDRQALHALMAGESRGANVERLLGLTLFELWRRRYNIALPA